MTTTVDEAAPTVTISDRLVHEVLNGVLLGYKRYLEVLVGTFCGYLWNRIDRKGYQLVTSEAGMHIGPTTNFAADIAIFDRVTSPALKGKHVDVAPKVIIDVDIRIDWENSDNNINYILEKLQTPVDLGVEPVLDGHSLTIKTLLDEEDITF